ncbi:ankyrin repeat domain-containing protein 26-like, partial [Rhincodon typus]|uniref:ankyrin repeat domain-containing protein 26 n=1 Tax=Rhincodon typus TaxID=259920 RepID=UPI0020301FB9
YSLCFAVADDASQTESVSRASKGAGDSWLSSNEDEELQFNSKVSQKLSLTKLLNTSQQSKDNEEKSNFAKVRNTDNLHPVESDIDSEEESEEDSCDEEEINNDNCSPVQRSPQSKTPLLASPQTAMLSSSSFIKNRSNSTLFRGYKQDRSSEEETWPVEMCSPNSRVAANQPANLDGASTYSTRAEDTFQQKHRKDLLFELGLEEVEPEEHIESPWDSESTTESSQKKSIGSLHSSVKDQAKMQHVLANQNNEIVELNTVVQPSLTFEENKQKSDLVAELGLIVTGDIEDASDWDSFSVSGKNVSPNLFSSVPQVQPITNDGKATFHSAESSKSLESKPKSNSEETTCIHGTSQSPDSLKTKLTAHPSVQYQGSPEPELKNMTSVKLENKNETDWNSEEKDIAMGKRVPVEHENPKVQTSGQQEFDMKISLSEDEDDEKEKYDWKVEKVEEKNKHFQNQRRNKDDKLGNSESAEDENSWSIKQKLPHEKSIQLQNNERLDLKLAKERGASLKQSQTNITSKLDKETQRENFVKKDRTRRPIFKGPFKSSASKKFTRPVNISDDLDDLTQSSDTGTDGSESPSSAYKNTPLLIAQLDTEAIDSISLLKIQNLVHEYERAVEREKKRYALLSEKVKYLENERKELHQALDKTREMKSKLECQKMERDTDFNSVKFSLKQEEEKRKIAEMLYEKSREQLQKKELQYCEELKAKQELELIIRNMEMERKSLISNIEQVVRLISK